MSSNDFSVVHRDGRTTKVRADGLEINGTTFEFYSMHGGVRRRVTVLSDLTKLSLEVSPRSRGPAGDPSRFKLPTIE
jgi:hypothetical protein